MMNASKKHWLVSAVVSLVLVVAGMLLGYAFAPHTADAAETDLPEIFKVGNKLVGFGLFPDGGFSRIEVTILEVKGGWVRGKEMTRGIVWIPVESVAFWQEVE